MIRLWYSNYLEELVEALVENVRALRDSGATDPFQPTTVIVPNRNIATFLKFSVAQRTGIIANWRFDYLYRFFREALVDDTVQILGKDDLHELLIELLRDEDVMKQGELASVAAYLAHGIDEDARDRRTFQLAGQIAHVFEEYALSRPRLLELWQRGTVLDRDPFAATERWQRRVWLEMFGADGRVERAANRVGKELVLLPETLDRLPASSLRLPDQVHVFGLSYVARSFYKLFAQLAERTHLLVYTLNPCMEYWEDVPSGWNLGHAKTFERRSAEQSTLFLDADPAFDDSPPALRAWGKPGRDNIHSLNMLTECDFAGRFIDPTATADTVLHRLQRDILVRQPVVPDPDRRYDDDSITFLECPNVQREVEVVANEIWDLRRAYAERGESLEFHDIAVIVNNKEREAYQARIRSVFKDTGDIPHNIIDITASSHRRYLEAVELLLALPFGRFTRRELLRLLTHDNVVAGLDGVDPNTWIRWCSDLNIVHGADHADHADTYIEEDLYNWDQGLKRLVLGTFMTGDERVVSLSTGDYLPHEVPPSEVENAARLVRLARSLIAEARRLGAISMPLGDWFEHVNRLVHMYLEPASDDDEYDRVRVTQFLARARRRGLSEAPVPFRIAYEFVVKELAALEVSRGQYLSEGVVVSSFLPMRPIPFKVVFVTGLGERNFPRSDVRSPLDLRWAPELEHVRGDVISARAQDEYMFLETLVSTRERLYLSYVARDGQTGEPLEPSSVVRLLSFMLEQNYVTSEVLANLHRKHPLRRWEDPHIAFQPEAAREARVKRARDELGSFCAERRVPYPDVQRLSRDLDDERREALRALLSMQELPDASVSTLDEGGVRTVRLWQILKFLESPVQGAASYYLGVGREEDDPFGVEDEVFETSFAHRRELMRSTFLRALVEHEAAPTDAQLAEHYDELARTAVLRGVVPAGPFGRADRAKHVQVLNRWLSNWRALGLGAPAVVSFGGVTEEASVATLRDPLRLTVDVDGRDVEVEIVGKTEVLCLASGASVVLDPARPPRGDGMSERPFLRGFLDQVVLAADGVAPGREWLVALDANAELHDKYHVRRFAPFDAEQARRYLATIVGDMLARVPAYFLPCEAIFAHRYSKKRRSLERWIDEFREKWDWCSFKSGPVHEPQTRFDLPPHPEAHIERRFGPYFERRRVR